MDGKVKVFCFKDQQDIRTKEIGGEVWFAVGDLCRGLGLCANSKNANGVAQRSLRHSELRKEYLPATFSCGGVRREGLRKMLLTNESGVYTLIMRSNKPEAQEFRVWVTNEVLPSIRKTGSYTMSQSCDVQVVRDKKQFPSTLTLSAGTKELSLVVSISSGDRFRAEQVKELYVMADDLITRAMEKLSEE